MQIAPSMIVPTFDQDRRVSAVSTRLEAQIAPQSPLSSVHRYTDVRCNGRDLDKGEICSGCDADAHGQSIDVVGDGSGAGAGARWSAGKDNGARGTRWPEAGRLPCIATYRLIRLALGFHPMSQHTLFEAASGLDLGYEYVGTRSSSIAALRLQRREDAFANHLPSYSQLAEFATGGLVSSPYEPLYCRELSQCGGAVYTDSSHTLRIVFRCIVIRARRKAVTIKVARDSGVLIMNGDMIQARFLMDGSGRVHGAKQIPQDLSFDTDTHWARRRRTLTRGPSLPQDLIFGAAE
ncbi:hypothetical protein B0H13DRAFT_1857469 [Mycena leptocephala]|nr:hypothetical protein B0H13DRAFT_1857469 [Mycena leptocephala]